MIVIPAVDIRRGRAVRLREGKADEETAYADDPVSAATTFLDAGAERLHLVDLDAAFGSGDNRQEIRGILGIGRGAFQVGGGIRALGEAAELLEAGADRIVIGTEAVKTPAFLTGAVERLGEAVVVALDVLGDRVRIRGWTDEAGSLDDVLPRVLEGGAPRILVTQVSRDGTLRGPDVELYERLVSRTQVPILASGGVKDAQDIAALKETGVEAVVVGKAFYEGRLRLEDALEAAR